MVRSKAEQVFGELQALDTYTEFERNEHEADARQPRSIKVRKKIDEALLSRMFELRARNALHGCIGSLDTVLKSVWAVRIENQRGQPRKYSKDFLVLRLSRIYERYTVRRASVRLYRERSDVAPREHDRGPFFEFVLTAIRTLEPSYPNSSYGLEKEISRMLRLRKQYPEVDLLIQRFANPDDLAEFCRLTQSKRQRKSTDR
jgi:hypothetical protein